MAEYDSALPTRGSAVDGAANDANLTLSPVMGSDGANYFTLLTDSSGRLVLDPSNWDDTNKVVITDGSEDLNIQTDGATIGTTGIMLLGSDGTDAQFFKVDTAGALFVNTGGALSNSNTFATTNLVKDTPTTLVTLVGPVVVDKIVASGSGLMKIEVEYGVTASEAVIAVFFNSTANPNIEFCWSSGLTVASGETILLTATNLENASSPTSDFDGYGTIMTQS